MPEAEAPPAPGPVLPPASEPEVETQGGKYLLKAVWNELTSKPGLPKVFKKHRPGEVVTLLAHDAERFLRHGIVEPTTKEQAAATAAQAVTPTQKAQAIAAPFLPTPVTPPPS